MVKMQPDRFRDRTFMALFPLLLVIGTVAAIAGFIHNWQRALVGLFIGLAVGVVIVLFAKTNMNIAAFALLGAGIWAYIE